MRCRIASLVPASETRSGAFGHPLIFAGILLITGVSWAEIWNYSHLSLTVFSSAGGGAESEHSLRPVGRCGMVSQSYHFVPL